MNKNKYYTPEIEEFHVGFEYEYNTMSECGSSTRYVKDIFKDTDNVNDLFKDLPNDWYDYPRVKYLDREDIESLGWEGQKANSVYFKKGKYRLVHWLSDNKIGRDISIYESYDGGTQEEALIRKAIIKNKSELKRLLKQLNILDE